jgi:hypothetical protein
MWVETERRSDLKEESSDLKQSKVAGKDTRECVRERDWHKMELYH